MAMTDFKIVRRSLSSRLFSTVITSLTVATAVGLMLVLLTMPDAGQQAFMRGNGNMHMLVSRDPSALQSVLNGVFYAEAPGNPIDWATHQRLLEEINTPLEYAIPTQQGDSYRGYPVLASTAEFFSRFRPGLEQDWVFASGRAFERPFEVVAGAQVARELGLTAGQELILTHGAGASRQRTQARDEAEAEAERAAEEEQAEEHDEDEGPGHEHEDFGYTVVGILEQTGGPHDRALFTDLDSAWIIHAHDRRERELGRVQTTTVDDLTDDDRKITGLYLRVASRQGAAMSPSQQAAFDQIRSLQPQLKITVADPAQEIRKLFAIVHNVDQLFLAIAAVVMISSGIAIMLALYNSMEQRRRQIAVLRVLGCSRRRIFGLVVTESAILGLIGAIVGIVLAWFGAEAVAIVMNQRLGLVIDAGLPVRAMAAVLLATIALAALAGLIPALRAYRTAVVENLRPLG